MDFNTELENLNSLNPDPFFRAVPAKDKLRLFAVVLGILPYELICFLQRRIFLKSPLSWMEELKRVVGRL
jgi:hypothetical protein